MVAKPVSENNGWVESATFVRAYLFRTRIEWDRRNWP